MPVDPTLSSDTAIFVEAIAGDGGTHDASAEWRLSPDIQLTGPTSGLDRADLDVDNTIKVTVHRKADGTLPAHTYGVAVDLFVGNPVPEPRPDDRASTVLIQSGFIDLSDLAPGSTAVKTIVWQPHSSTPGAAPDGRGQKCLIARCYPDALTPTASSFFLPDDPHVARHNITVGPPPDDGGGDGGGTSEPPGWTGLPNENHHIPHH